MNYVHPIRVILIAEQGLARDALQHLLSTFDDVELLTSVDNNTDALLTIAEHMPDVVIVEVSAVDELGLEIIRGVHALQLNTRLLALAVQDEPSLFRAVWQAGASAYVSKTVPATELAEALRAVAKGRTHVHLSSDHPEFAAIFSGSSLPTHDTLQLSPRERDVFELLAYGYSNREIGLHLHLSEKTVGTYRARLSEKLQLGRRSDVVRCALQHGVLSAERIPLA